MKRFLFISACLLCANLLGQSIPCHVPTNGLVGWWPFDGNANDLSGNGNNASYNTALSISDRQGNNGAAYSFGGGNYVVVPNSSSISSIQSGITISVWATLSTTVTNARILELRGAYGNGGDAGFVIYYKDNGPKFELRWYNSTGSNDISISTTPAITQMCPNCWVNLTYTADGATAVGQLYINGVLFANNNGQPSQGPIGQCNYNNQPLYIGTEQYGGATWGGGLDDFGLWNRALSANEVMELYSGYAGSLVESPSNSSNVAGSTATFTALSSSSSATYQWQVKNGSSVTNLSNAGQFSGANSSTLSVSNISSANYGLEFRCIVDHGLCLDTTSFATLSLCTGAFQSSVDTLANTLTFSSVQSNSAPAAVPSDEIWKINQITYQAIPAQATNNTGTQSVVDKIQINCHEITVRKTSTSSNNSGASNVLSWETKLPIWLPPGTLIEPGTGVEALNIIRFKLNPL
jgi:hypothetical protein